MVTYCVYNEVETHNPRCKMCHVLPAPILLHSTISHLCSSPQPGFPQIQALTPACGLAAPSTWKDIPLPRIQFSYSWLTFRNAVKMSLPWIGLPWPQNNPMLSPHHSVLNICNGFVPCCISTSVFLFTFVCPSPPLECKLYMGKFVLLITVSPCSGTKLTTQWTPRKYWRLNKCYSKNIRTTSDKSMLKKSGYARGKGRHFHII